MLLCLTASHRDTDFTTLGHLSALSGSEVASGVSGVPGVRGAVVLSTCNRFELYLELEEHHRDTATEGVRQALTERLGDSVLHELSQADAAEHLFAVTSGLESVVIGEGEIAGQVRRALTEAQKHQRTSPELERLFQKAIQTQRAVKSRTGLGAARPSLVRLGLDLASYHVPDWASVPVLLIGTGRYATTSLAALRDRGVTQVEVWSPSGRGADFAARHQVTLVSHGGLAAATARARVILTCTTSERTVIDAEVLRAGRPDGVASVARSEDAACPVGTDASPVTVLIDLGLPRNINPDVASVSGIALLDLEAIKLHAPLEHLAASEDAREVVREAAAAFAQAGLEGQLASADDLAA
ncbi:MAG: glutamyl-tRNA reductase [Micropruina sp.]|nr:glutamyl-tRNA reductase [Micropruina sp.]